jgi:eukaryotic-like serine/threonine-protein kinase
MADILQQLAQALAPRYTIERELGRGMAFVYLAQDLKLHRPVAIKVPRPDLAAVLGAERFLREIEIAARLNHPHILALHECGQAAGFLYYVMPYVEGGSLRDRLARERQLPIEEAVRITEQVANALSYAHAQDVVHRDVKPGNILLANTGAMVTDFGIARAITVAGGEELTSRGIVVGTPEYMSPEQGAGEPHLDGRSDVFSLGCVVYEMLTGTPPFVGTTAQAIQARRTRDPVPPLRTVRESIPASVEQAIERALAKVPADRFATPTDFARALSASPTAWRRRRRASQVVAAATVIAAISLGVAKLVEPHRSVNEPADPHVVAVFPFRVVGADPTLGYLREGMVDLLTVKLNGVGGPRALDPRALLGAWRRALPSTAEDLPLDAALVVAHRLGAGRLVDGAVVGTPSHLILTAAIVAVPSGITRARASVPGTADSLPALIDRLTAAILAGESGRIELDTVTSLPALQAYLVGQSAIRAGRFKDAFQSFHHALELDSTFALAGIGLGRAAFWNGGDDSGRGFRVAWAARDRLSPRDLAIIAPWMVPGEEHLATAERAVVTIPESPEAW